MEPPISASSRASITIPFGKDGDSLTSVILISMTIVLFCGGVPESEDSATTVKVFCGPS